MLQGHLFRTWRFGLFELFDLIFYGFLVYFVKWRKRARLFEVTIPFNAGIELNLHFPIIPLHGNIEVLAKLNC